MRDCRAILEIQGGKASLQMSGAGMLELAAMAGYIQLFLGREAMRRGMDYDDAVLKLLDVHLAAMEELKKTARQAVGRKEENNGGNADTENCG